MRTLPDTLMQYRLIGSPTTEWVQPHALPIHRQLADVVTLTAGPWLAWDEARRFVGQCPVGADVLVEFAGIDEQPGEHLALALAGALDWSDGLDADGQIARFRVWTQATATATTGKARPGGRLRGRPARSKRPHTRRAVRRAPAIHIPDWLF